MKKNSTNLLWGLFFIVLGVGITCNILFDYNFFFRGWWTLFIIVPCALTILRHGFNVGNSIGLCIGILLLLHSQDILHDYISWRLIFPMILIIIGISIMWNSLFKRTHYDQSGSFTYHKPGKDVNSIFSSQNIDYNNVVFEGIELNSVFGGIVLDLSHAIINQDACIECSCVFGGIDIYVPNNINIRIEGGAPFLGGVTNKVKRAYISGAPTLLINASCVFGGVDIK